MSPILCVPVVHQVRIRCEEFVFVVAQSEVVDHGCLSYAIVESRIHPYSSDSVNELIGSNVKGSNLIDNDWCVIPTGFNFHRRQKCSCKWTIVSDEESMEPSHLDTTSWFLQNSAKSWGIGGLKFGTVQYKYYIPRCVHMPGIRNSTMPSGCNFWGSEFLILYSKFSII